MAYFNIYAFSILRPKMDDELGMGKHLWSMPSSGRSQPLTASCLLVDFQPGHPQAPALVTLPIALYKLDGRRVEGQEGHAWP